MDYLKELAYRILTDREIDPEEVVELVNPVWIDNYAMKSFFTAAHRVILSKSVLSTASITAEGVERGLIESILSHKSICADGIPSLIAGLKEQYAQRVLNEAIQSTLGLPTAAERRMRLFNLLSEETDFDDDSKAPSCMNLWQEIEEDRKLNSGKILIGLPTPWIGLDEVTGGIQKGHLILIGAPTSAGKSAVGIEFIYKLVQERKKCVIFSTEMARKTYLLRLAARHSNVPGLDYQRDRATPNEIRMATEIIHIADASDLRIYDAVYDVERMKTVVAMENRIKNVELVLVDFVQNVSIRGESVYERMSKAAIYFQQMAKHFNVPIILMSQVSNETARNWRYGDDILAYKGAGELAAACDWGVLLTRDQKDIVLEDNYHIADLLYFRLQKHRHGPTGIIELAFNNRYTRLDPYEEKSNQIRRATEEEIQAIKEKGSKGKKGNK